MTQDYILVSPTTRRVRSADNQIRTSDRPKNPVTCGHGFRRAVPLFSISHRCFGQGISRSPAALFGQPAVPLRNPRLSRVRATVSIFEFVAARKPKFRLLGLRPFALSVSYVFCAFFRGSRQIQQSERSDSIRRKTQSKHNPTH